MPIPFFAVPPRTRAAFGRGARTHCRGRLRLCGSQLLDGGEPQRAVGGVEPEGCRIVRHRRVAPPSRARAGPRPPPPARRRDSSNIHLPCANLANELRAGPRRVQRDVVLAERPRLARALAACGSPRSPARTRSRARRVRARRRASRSTAGGPHRRSAGIGREPWASTGPVSNSRPSGGGEPRLRVSLADRPGERERAAELWERDGCAVARRPAGGIASTSGGSSQR